jgi:cytochrome c-type biogenesis protein CcsB
VNKLSLYKVVSKFVKLLFGTKAGALYILVFASTIGIATFIENDFGTSAAQKVVYRAKWFELLLLLFSGSLISNIIKYRMFQNRKWALLIFHLSMIIILIGAGVTRYYGYEGIMHIREDDSAHSILSSETYIQFEAIDRVGKYHFDEAVLFASLGNNQWSESYQVGQQIIKAKVIEFIPNPIQEIEDVEDGLPIIKVVFGSSEGREEYLIQEGESKRLRGVMFNFSKREIPGAFNILFDEELRFKSNQAYTQTVMATQQRDTILPIGQTQPLMLKSLYSNGISSFVFGEFRESGRLQVTSNDRKVKNESMTALKIKVDVNGQVQEKFVFGKKGLPGQPTIFPFENLSLAVRYGAKPIELPFEIKLYDFQMERYPGTNSAASYASEVQLIDYRSGHKEDYRIYMNHILDYGGYRFFQSSFDQDEKGTYLSVNHDFWGTWISYLGYFLLTLGLIMVFFSRNTRFYQVRKKIQKLRDQRVALVSTFLFTASFVSAQMVINPEIEAISHVHAALFSEMIVQDHKGRMKPVHTLSRELLRKISRTENMLGLSADQVILGMYADKNKWLNIPIIKSGKSKQIGEILRNENEFLAYKDFFNVDGSYKLRDEVRRAYGLQPIDRGTLEKDLMKIDERVNIVSMIFSGRILKLIPVEDDENNTWISAVADHGHDNYNRTVADNFFSTYSSSLHDAQHGQNYSFVDKLLHELKDYQKKHGSNVYPSNAQIRLEILLNKLNVFNRLSLYYFIAGLLLLALLFFTIFSTRYNWRKVYKVFFILVVLGFIFHTVGLGIRWYVSERAPWSNGYESMIYIAWTSVLAGLIFARKNIGGLAATMILAGSILLVAMLSYLDPEITPLVPVLRSYWLTIHVSLIAGSYGFLMLGAIIGVINLLLMIFSNKSNQNKVKSQIKELTLISEITIVGGLIMISIGTYLGGVWANESWGRYWGWDAKETWALVTILVYAFILHMRLIPGLKGLYAFNVATLFGMASVIMTYFGVNYYLSGLHSYAAGDPIPIPTWVYIAVASLLLITAVAYFKRRNIDL